MPSVNPTVRSLKKRRLLRDFALASVCLLGAGAAFYVGTTCAAGAANYMLSRPYGMGGLGGMIQVAGFAGGFTAGGALFVAGAKFLYEGIKPHPATKRNPRTLEAGL